MLMSLILAFTLPAQTPADRPAPAPYVKFEPQINAKPGEAFVVKVDSNLVYRKWTLPPGLTIVPAEHTKYGDTAIVCFGPVGAYRFKLEGTFNDKWAEGETVVFVGQPSPIPPGPPNPPHPIPPESLVAELQRLYDADQGRDKAADKVKLNDLWCQAGIQLAGNPKFTTVRQFRETLHATSSEWPFSLDPSDLRALREKIAAELSAAVGNDATSLGAPDSPVRIKGKAVR
jgi:hypothetical protein